MIKIYLTMEESFNIGPFENNVFIKASINGTLDEMKACLDVDNFIMSMAFRIILFEHSDELDKLKWLYPRITFEKDAITVFNPYITCLCSENKLETAKWLYTLPITDPPYSLILEIFCNLISHRDVQMIRWLYSLLIEFDENTHDSISILKDVSETGDLETIQFLYEVFSEEEG